MRRLAHCPVVLISVVFILAIFSTVIFFIFFFFFFNDTATTEIYTLSLHDALPICNASRAVSIHLLQDHDVGIRQWRSEEHTSELQSLTNLVCRLLLEKKKA